MNERNPAIRRPENFSSDLVEMRCGQYPRTARSTIDEMFDDTAKESRAICMAELVDNATADRRDRRSRAKTNNETTGKATRERRSDYEPVDKVPFPNSSRMISECSVQFLRANETWLRSIMKADCS
jgi:hypothetical protein